MKITQKTRQQIRIQGITSTLLFMVIIGLLAWLSRQYQFELDWTATGRNTLSEATVTLLERIPGKVQITAFARSERQPLISELIKKYQKYKPDIELEFINPDLAPDKTRAMGITLDGELVIAYQDRSEHVQSPREVTITNTLQRLLRSGERKVLFITGHGERKPDGVANHDYNNFANTLKSKGIILERISLAETPTIPANTSMLVIASPLTDFLPGETKLIIDYLEQGGNLLWLQEPGTPLHGLEPLQKLLGIEFYNGTVVDPTTQLLGINDPSFSIMTSYPQHAITSDSNFMTIFPKAVAIKHDAVNNKWQADPFLVTVERSWSETGAMSGVIDFNAGSDIPGPLTIGLALSLQQDSEQGSVDKNNSKKKAQRIVLIGDGDFLSNTYLGNGGNQNLGYNIFNWLSHDDSFINIPSRNAPDRQLSLTELQAALLGLLFLIVIPLALLASGITIWMKRRKR